MYHFNHLYFMEWSINFADGKQVKKKRLLHFVHQTGIVRFFLLFWAIWRQNFDNFILEHTEKWLNNWISCPSNLKQYTWLHRRQVIVCEYVCRGKVWMKSNIHIHRQQVAVREYVYCFSFKLCREYCPVSNYIFLSVLLSMLSLAMLSWIFPLPET